MESSRERERGRGRKGKDGGLWERRVGDGGAVECSVRSHRGGVSGEVRVRVGACDLLLLWRWMEATEWVIEGSKE